MAGTLDGKERLYGIDLAKGCLIILVFVGHMIPGAIGDVFPRYAIYSFHMPLFIGISGFLLKIEKLDISFSHLLPKYWNRLILPWSIAVLFFLLDHNIYNGIGINVKNVVYAFVHPWYHLWYILGFVSYLVISCVLWTLFNKLKHRWLLMLLVAFIISIISKWSIFGIVFTDGYSKTLHDLIQFDFRLYNYVFFAIGLFFRYCYEHGKMLSAKAADIFRSILIVSMMMVCFEFFKQNSNVGRILFFVMCIPFLIVVLYDCVNKCLPRSKTLEFLGKYSLPIYLYHILCLQIAHVFFEGGSTGYYVVSLAGFIMMCVLFFIFRNNKMFGRLLFGTMRRGHN